MNVWKIASKWGEDDKNLISILHIFKKYNVVFVGSKERERMKKEVKVWDYIAVTDGISVVSVGIVTSFPKSVTEFDFEHDDLKDFDYENWVVGIKVILFDLKQNEIFNYKRGAFHEAHGEYKKQIIDFVEREKIQVSPEIFSEEKNILPFAIKQVKIFNYRGIKELQIKNIPIDAQWIFFTGKNGFGKTSILRSIAIALHGNYQKSLDPKSEILTMLELKKANETRVNNLYQFEFDKLEKLATYGAYRTQLHPTADTIYQTDSLFEKSIYVMNFESRFKEMEAFEDLKKERNYIIDILKKLIPNLEQIEIVKDENIKGGTKVVYYEKTDDGQLLQPYIFSELAMGMRSIIGFVTDMVFRLSQNQNIENDLSGIVIIDEFDNHLHPDWQRELVKKLSEIFPKIQFIASTHSPIPLLGAPPDRTVILNVNRTKEEGITVRRLEKLEKELKYLTPNQLLTSDIFGLDEIENIYLKDDEIDKVAVEDNYNDIEKNKKLIDDLEQRAKNKELFPYDLFNLKND